MVVVSEEVLEFFEAVSLGVNVANICVWSGYFLEVKDVEFVSSEVVGEFVPEIVGVGVELEKGESHIV